MKKPSVKRKEKSQRQQEKENFKLRNISWKLEWRKDDNFQLLILFIKAVTLKLQKLRKNLKNSIFLNNLLIRHTIKKFR